MVTVILMIGVVTVGFSQFSHTKMFDHVWLVN